MEIELKQDFSEEGGRTWRTEEGNVSQSFAYRGDSTQIAECKEEGALA